ncbi:MAG: hypothetical protein ACE5GB_15280 [Acidimicrobiales bacterium]
MDRHGIDPLAFTTGAVFAAAGVGMLADRAWDSADLTTVGAAALALLGAGLIGVTLRRSLSDPNPAHTRAAEPGAQSEDA